MANTYTKIYLHIIFAVKHRQALMPALYLPKIHAYIRGIISNSGHVPVSVGGVDDHVHILIQYNVNQPVPELVKQIKTSTTRYINSERWIPFKFEWQAGYGCFSYSNSQVDAVMNYIVNQNVHHKGFSLEDEIKNILDRFGVEYNPDYILKEPS